MEKNVQKSKGCLRENEESASLLELESWCSVIDTGKECKVSDSPWKASECPLGSGELSNIL